MMKNVTLNKICLLFFVCVFLLDSGCGPSQKELDSVKKQNQELQEKIDVLELKTLKDTYYNRKTNSKADQGYIGITFGAGGQADGPSTSLEIGRIKQERIIGLGGSWLGTNDLSSTYYLNAAAPSGSTGQGFYNEGDEYELFGVYGKKLKDKIFIVGTLGVSQQKKVDLDKAPSGALYVKSRAKDNYITLSAQLRHVMNNGNMLSVGFHTRRGFLAGINIKW